MLWCLFARFVRLSLLTNSQPARLQARGLGEHPLGLLRREHQRQLLRLLHVPELGSKLVMALRHPNPGHDAVAIADARAARDEVQLEAALGEPPALLAQPAA